ncbi:hypothetical protein JXA80_11730 [bacterium]|nr:hypothetical protein [candidate division CSSED10-310 bacterium]
MESMKKAGFAFLLIGLFLILTGYLSGCDDDSITGDEADPTPVPTTGPGVGPAPPPDIPDQPCARGRAVVKITNIPDMNNGNKDDLNKLQLFCLRDNANVNFVGVFHRYVQPDWPDGPWFSAWRLEAGADGCIEEWHIYDAHPLAGDSAVFEIEWDHNFVSVTHQGTGDRQFLHMDSSAGYQLVGRPGDCTRYGNPSFTSVETLSYTCTAQGNPTGC